MLKTKGIVQTFFVNAWFQTQGKDVQVVLPNSKRLKASTLKRIAAT